MSGLQFPKGRPAILDKDDRRRAIVSTDRDENDRVKVRSGGRCEIEGPRLPRCRKRGAHVHHLMGGWGVRGRGESALAENKVHACAHCHRLIHGHALRHLGKRRFERVS